MKNPFKPAEATARFLKILLFGLSGTGKTIAALSFPGVAVVDAEGGTTLYRGRPGIPPFLVMDAKTLTELEEAVKFVQEDGGKTIKTLVIDPISVFYKIQREATAQSSKRKEKDMGMREWAKLNMRMSVLYTSLTNLPCHVIVIAREATEYEGSGDEMRKAGVKPDADKDIPYPFDFVIQMQKDHSGLVIKSRGAELAEKQRIKTVNWDVFRKFAEVYSSGVPDRVIDDESAILNEAEREVLREQFQDRDIVVSFVKEWNHQGAEISDIQSALGVEKLSQWTQGLNAARKAMRRYMGLDKQAEKFAPEQAIPDPIPTDLDPATDQTENLAGG